MTLHVFKNYTPHWKPGNCALARGVLNYQLSPQPFKKDGSKKTAINGYFVDPQIYVYIYIGFCSPQFETHLFQTIHRSHNFQNPHL